MRVVLSLPFSDSVVNDAIRRLPGVEVVKETPYYNQAVLKAVVDLSPAPDVVIVGEALPQDAKLSLRDYVAGLRQADLRVIFLADKSQPGDSLLAELVTMNVTDIIIGGSVSIDELAQMIHAQTSWGKVSYLLHVTRGQKAPSVTIGPTPAPTPTTPPPDAAPREVVVERVVERVVEVQVQVQAHRKKVVAVLGIGPEGAGVSTVASNVATAIAASGVKVALVDGDTLWPSISNHFNLSFEHNGLDGVVKGLDPQQIGVKTRANLTVFASQIHPARPAAGSLGESDCLSLLDRLQANYEQVVVDLGYQLHHPFYRTAVRLASDVLLVVNLDPHRIVIANHELSRMGQMTTLTKFKLVVNGVDPSHKHLKALDVEMSLEKVELVAELPWTPMATEAAAQCVPLFDTLPGDSLYVQAIRKLAGVTVSGQARKGWWPFK